MAYGRTRHSHPMKHTIALLLALGLVLVASYSFANQGAFVKPPYDAPAISSIDQDGKPIKPTYGGTSGRPNWMVPVELERGQSTQLHMVFKVTKCPASSN